MAREFDLDALLHGAPAGRGGKLGAELLELRLRRPDDVAPAGLAQPGEVVGARHAAVGDPDASQHAVARLHGGHDRLQGARIVGVAGEHLVAQRKAVEGHHQRDAHLLAVGTVIARVAAPGLWVGFRQALEIRAGDVVEQHFVVDREQLAAALRQIRLKGGLVDKQAIEAAIEPILVDFLVAELKQIAQRRATVPIFRNVQLARRLAEPRRHQHRRHLRPRDALLPGRQQPLAQLLETHAAPQRQRQIYIAEHSRALDPNALEAHRHRLMRAAVVEQLRLLRSPDQPARQCPRFDPPVLVKLAEMRHRLLNDATTDANAPHQPPIAVNLPVLPQCRVPQIHGGESNLTRRRQKIPLVGTTRPNPLLAPTQLIDLSEPPRQIDSPFRDQTAQVGLVLRTAEVRFTRGRGRRTRPDSRSRHCD